MLEDGQKTLCWRLSGDTRAITWHSQHPSVLTAGLPRRQRTSGMCPSLAKLAAKKRHTFRTRDLASNVGVFLTLAACLFKEYSLTSSVEQKVSRSLYKVRLEGQTLEQKDVFAKPPEEARAGIPFLSDEMATWKTKGSKLSKCTHMCNRVSGSYAETIFSHRWKEQVSFITKLVVLCA